MSTHIVAVTKPEQEYELLDSGDGEKLERYGSVVVSRPDPQALWHKQASQSVWGKAHAVFTREATQAGWEFRTRVPEQWTIQFSGLTLAIRPSSFKHTGLFPEQSANWQWTREQIMKRRTETGGEVQVLNLFGYTGAASLACAQAGASVCHVDGSKVAVAWARENAALSQLSEKPIRWIIDDVVTFVTREVKRGRKYDGIILDPPAFGHGPNKEMWKIEEDLLPLLDLCKKVLSDTPLFFLMNGYAAGYSPIAYGNNVEELMRQWEGTTEIGELAIEESTSGRLLPCGIFARWSAV